MNDKKPFLEKLIEFIKSEPLIFILIGLCIIISIVSPVFLLPQNIINVLIQISINALIATGMTFVIISGGIDLSVGSVAALSGIVVTAVILPFAGISILMCLLIIVVLSVIVGFISGGISGFAISRLRVPPFVATLAMMNIARGFAYVYTNSRSIYGLPEAFGWIGQGYIGFIPVIVIIVIIVLLIAHIVLDRTVFGRASRLITGQPTAAQGYELNAIAAVVLGMGGMSGGKGGIGKTIQGILVIGVINNGLNLMRVSSYWQIITMGAIILGALIIGQFKKED
jgi:ribose transport system permease protein/inositol transport system permease protein